MSEVSKKQITETIHYRCDSCNKGNMFPTQRSEEFYGGTIEHQCVHCGAILDLLHAYPLTIHHGELA